MKNLSYILGLIFLAAVASAQPSLNIKRVELAWPMVEIAFTAECDGNAVIGLLPQDISLSEDGIPVSQFDLSCPTSGGVCQASVALLFDASGSMVGSGNAGAKLAGHAFIDRMRGNVDEAAVLYFTQVVSLEQSMTMNKALLHSAVDRLPASGATALWDGIYAAIDEVASNGTGDARAVIALSDGTDNSSTKLVTDIIALALQHGVRVYTVLLGTSGSNELETIAQSTGGEFVQTPNAGQLQAIYEGFANQLTHCFRECTLSYESRCADGGTRTLDLTVNNLCGKSVTASGSFTAPQDSTDRQPLPLYLSSSHTMGRREITVQLNLPQVQKQYPLYPSILRLHYDDQSLIFKKVDVPPVSVMHGVQWTHQEMPGLVQVQTYAPVALNGTGPLLELTFEARDVQDTICSEIGLTSWVTPYGCLVPEVTPGEICVYPWSNEPLVFCEISPEMALEWRASRRGYVPDPVTVSARFDNNGSATARSGMFVVDYDHSVLRRIQPAQDTVIYAIPDIVAGSHAAVAWDFEALQRENAGVAQVCITGQFDNHPDVYCCTNILIPASGPVLACDITIPPIVANPNRGEYEPMPFPVSVRIRNMGKTDTDTVRVRLIVPPDLALLPGEVEEKMAQPAVLGGAESSTLVWMLTHGTTAVKRQYLVEAWSRCANADSSRCESVVNIPALSVLDFRVQLQHSGALEICEGESVMLDAGKDHDSLRWNTGDTTQRIAVRKSGTYYCVLARGARTGYSDTVSVLVHPRPRPVLSAAGSVPLCPGDTVILDAGAGYVRYNWSNMLIQRRIPVTRAGTYYADVTDANGCHGRSDTVVVTMHPATPIPVITRNGDILSTASAAGWQWYRNGQPVSGGDVQNIHLIETGTYFVRITDANGCSSESDEIVVNVLDVAALPAAVRSFDVYPDPTVGGVTMDLRLERAELITIVVTNAIGQELTRIDSGHPVLDFSRHISLGTAPGVYFLRIAAGADSWVRRVVKMQ